MTETANPSSTYFRSLIPRIVPIAALCAVMGCETSQYRPNAIGKEGEIVVVIDSSRWQGALGDVLREELSPWIGTLPAPERLFSLRQISVSSQSFLKTIQKQKNIVFAAPLSDSTSEAAFLRSRLDEEAFAAVMAGDNAMVSRRDPWRRNQQVFYIFANTEEALRNQLAESGEDLRYAFNKITRERVTRDMFDRGRQPEIEKALLDRHGFAVNVQHDYFVAIDTTDFVWLRRVVNADSWRSLFVYYVDDASPASLTPEWIYEARERITRQWITGNLGGYVAIDFRRELQTENIDFLGRFGYETRGLWHMVGPDGNGNEVEYGMGGAFLNYSFYDQESRRIYIVDGMVFAPNFAKREFLRHMEAIAHTFRTQEDENRRGGV